MTKVLPCSCEHKQQDEMYGKGKRLMNATVKGSGSTTIYRCTVCAKER